MAEKIINSRIQLKTDTWLNWYNKPNFIPKKGEFIFYSDRQKFKIGDGIKKISELDYVNEDPKMVTKVQFDEVWKYLNEAWEIVHNGTLTSTQAYHYTEYDCISIDLYSPAEAAEVSNRYVYLFLQSNYYEDNDVMDYWRWVGYDRSNTKYTLDIVHNFDNDTWTWTLTTGSSSGSGSGSGGGIYNICIYFSSFLILSITLSIKLSNTVF